MSKKIWDIENGWPGGLSDGLTLACAICGEHTNWDYEVSNELWKDVVPDEHQRGVICLDCLDKLAKQNGYFLGNHLIQVQYTGLGETVILKPEESFVYGEIKNE